MRVNEATVSPNPIRRRALVDLLDGDCGEFCDKGLVEDGQPATSGVKGKRAAFVAWMILAHWQRLSSGRAVPRCHYQMRPLVATPAARYLLCRTFMNAIDMLTLQHRELEGAFKALMSEKPEVRGRLFEDAADTLMSHILVEESHFYPAVKAKKTEDILLESLEEHLSLKRVLADLVALSHTDPHFEPKLHVLKEQAEHHHKEEEEHLFPKVKKLLDAEELEALGDQMHRAQTELLARSPRKRVAEQTAKASDLI